MSDVDTKIKEGNEHIKELFLFNGDNTQLKHIKELFLNYIRKSDNGPRFFILFLEHYSLSRPNQHHVSKELIECIYSYFQEQINEIQQYIKSDSMHT